MENALNRIRQVFYVLLNGYILAYFSEWTFWLGQVRQVGIGEYVLTWLFYSFATYLFMLAVHYYHARTVWAVFLCGALYGWIVEGVIVQTMYEGLPLSISVTGLQWHALISVMLGWFYLRRWLMESDRKTLYGAVGIGVFYGCWSTGWWFNAEPQATWSAVTLEMTVLSVLLIVAYAGVARMGDMEFHATRRGRIGGLIGLGVLFPFAVIVQPVALVVFPLCAGFVLIFLRMNKVHDSAPFRQSAHVIPVRRLAMLLLISLIVSVMYFVAESAEFPLLAEPDAEGAPLAITPLIYLVTMVAGFGMLFYSAWRVRR